MKKLIPALCLCLLHFNTQANDGAFYGRGNHLVPVTETDISVKKEILTIRKTGNRQIEVTVYYEFFNPKEDKTVLVGFEAASPAGDVNGYPKNGLHPYMRDFTVNLNNQILSYQVAYISDSAYYKNGKINSRDLKEVEQNIENQNAVDFYYVYHFNAFFRKGLNIVKHTYTYDLSNSIEFNYHFDYILTAANRWANQRIDDFTLIVDMGNFELFNIPKTFFSQEKEWIINGIGKSSGIKADENGYTDKPSSEFAVQKGNLIFQKLNFKPAGEFSVYSKNYSGTGAFDPAANRLPYSCYQQDQIGEPADEAGRKILRNLPFARRGYVFTNKEIQHYYETMTDWYSANPNYKPEVGFLTEEEKKWVKKWE